MAKRRPRRPLLDRTRELVAQIRARRKEFMLTQTDVCQLADGLDLCGYCNMEKGNSCPSLDYFVRVAESLDLEVRLVRRRPTRVSASAQAETLP